jgi:serine/threonine protein kinase
VTEPNNKSNEESQEELDSPSLKGTQSGKEDPSEGSRTGLGFDTIVGKIVVERGLVTSDELDEALELAEQRRKLDPSLSVAEVLLDSEMLTRRQLDRVRSEYETDRNSQQIPGYKILRKLGSGAMATVFLARQISLDRLVAIKILPKRFSDNESFIERFYREGRAAAKLNDQNIVQAYDVGQAGEHHYFVMEYVDGETLYDAVTRDRYLDEHTALTILKQVASALRHAHERGFVHRDIKPKNIMLAANGTVKLADLGLARALSDHAVAEAEAGRAYGTPFYISPEQIRGRVKIGPEADIYGLGATAYHMVTGRVPFSGKSPSQVMNRHLKDEIVPPDHVNSKLSAGMAQIIEMMLEKRPSDRYSTAADLMEDIDLVIKGTRPLHAGTRLNLENMTGSFEAIQGEEKKTKLHPPQQRKQPERDSRSMLIKVAVGSFSLILLLIILILFGS